MDKGLYEYARYGSIGISWVLVTSIYIYLGYAGGNWLDRRLGSEPLFLVIGMVLGLGLSLRSLVVEVLALIKEAPSGGLGKVERAMDARVADHKAEKGSNSLGDKKPER